MKLIVSVLLACFFVESYGEGKQNDFDEILKEIAAPDYPRGRREDLVGQTVLSLLSGQDRVRRNDQMTDSYQPCWQGQYDEPYGVPRWFGLAREDEDARHKKPLKGISIDHYGESILSPLHDEKLYTAVIPVISGYKMSPIIAYKKVIVKDDKLGLFKTDPIGLELGLNKDLVAPGSDQDDSSVPLADNFQPASVNPAFDTNEIGVHQPQYAVTPSDNPSLPIPSNQYSSAPIPLTRILTSPVQPSPDRFPPRSPLLRPLNYNQL